MVDLAADVAAYDQEWWIEWVRERRLVVDAGPIGYRRTCEPPFPSDKPSESAQSVCMQLGLVRAEYVVGVGLAA